jgi:UMF1 family MFS transporter
MQTASKKVIHSWTMYDWANSVYSLVISSTIFPAFYEAVTGDGNETTLIDKVTIGSFTFINTALYNYVLAIAFIIVALLSPLLSSIADFRGNKKQFLRFFCTLGSLACCSFYFFDASRIELGLISMIVACIGFWSSLVFYNSYLPEIAAPADQDRVSAKGFMMGYIGAVILQLVCFVFVLKPDLFGITVGKASQISFLLAGIWWFGFGHWSITNLPASIKNTKTDQSDNVFVGGYKELHKVWLQLKKLPTLDRFLGAFFFYNMGVQTVMLAATLYGKSELNIPTTNLIIAILIIQLVAIPGAMLMSKMAVKIGNFNTLIIAVSFWIAICIIGYFVPRNGITEFYCLATMVGFVMGGIQSVSRSTYAKLMPPTEDTTSFFSFFDVTEKVAIVIGMFSFGFIIELTGSQKNAVLGLGAFFIIGLILLYRASLKNKHANL